MEETLTETPDSKGDMAEMKTMIERYKNISLQINEKHSEIISVIEEAREFSEKGTESDVYHLKVRWQSVNDKCEEVIDNLNLEIKDFNKYQLALQETEKWLLQISFQLMAENSHYINTKTQTEEQIARHNIQMNEIYQFQKILDDVKNQGHKQIDKYIGTVPLIQDKIERQLHNIQESFDSLVNTAKHIEKRLKDSLIKFEEYDSILESINNNLNEWEPAILEESDVSIQTMKEARYHLDCTRVCFNVLLKGICQLAARNSLHGPLTVKLFFI